MNYNDYNKRLDDLYNLLLNKLNNNNINSKIEQLIDNKFNLLENRIEKNINNKFNLLENKIEKNINLLENKIEKINKNISNISFYLNLLYMNHIYKNFNNIDSFIFNNKFNILFKKKQTSIIKGILIKDEDNIKINIIKQIDYDLNYIILTFYNKNELLNNYKFNFILQVKKLDNTTIIIEKNVSLEYKKFYEKYLDRTYNTIYFYKIDHLIDKINN